MAEFRKNSGRTRSEGGSCDETTAKKVITLQTAMTKKVVSFFSGKVGVTPSVIAPGDTNSSDVTGHISHKSIRVERQEFKCLNEDHN